MTIKLTREQAVSVIRVIGEYQQLLESSINSMLIPGTDQAGPGDETNLRVERMAWRAAEDVQMLIEQQIPDFDPEVDLA